MKKLFSSHNQVVLITKQLLYFLKVKVNAGSIEDKISNHPSPYSLSSISNSLTDWNVANLTLRLLPTEYERIHEFSPPFVGVLNEKGENQFVLVDKVEEDVIHYQNTEGGITEGLDEFFKHWTGYALLAFPTEKAGENERDFAVKKRETIISNIVLSILYTTILISLLGLFIMTYQSDLAIGGLILIGLKLVGLVICSLLIKHDFDKENSIINRVCSSVEKNDCNKILASKEAKLLGLISWSELGLVYFGGSLLFLLFSLSKMSDTIQLLFFLNTICIFFSFYSVWYQAFQAKDWCYFCLAILSVFALEFTILFPLVKWSFPMDWKVYIMGIFSFVVIGYLIIFIKLFLSKIKETKNIKSNLNSIKYNSNVFEQLLQSEKLLNTDNNAALNIFGNTDASNTITIVTNPSCKPCYQVHNQLRDYIKGSYDNLKINIVFWVDVGQDEIPDNYKVAKRIVALNYFKGQEIALKAMEDWYEDNQLKRNYEEWSASYPVENDNVDDVLTKHKQWCENSSLKFTPTIIVNQKQLPKFYQVSDLKYFMG